MTDLHDHTEYTQSAAHGSAVTSCYELDDGTLWISNDEYASQVNFCPFCGYQAKVRAECIFVKP